MKKLTFLSCGISLLFFAFTFSSCCKPDKIASIDVNLRPQETNNWCWLANTQMIHEFFGGSVTQCSLANSQLGKSNCCTPEEEDGCPKNDDCNNAGSTQSAIESLGYTLTLSTTPLSWEDLRKKVDCGEKPLVFGDGPSGGGTGHVRVIYGYAEAGGVRYVYLKDPWSPCEGSDDEITYETYSKTTGTGRLHRKTLYDITKN